MHVNAASKTSKRRNKAVPRHPMSKPHGYTLTEVIAVLAIIAILATAVISVGRYAMKRARIGKATGTFHKIELAIGLYQKDFGNYIPDSVKTFNGDSLRDTLSKLKWPRSYSDALGPRRSKPKITDYDKPSEILFFFLQDMFDAMNSDAGSRQANRLLLASFPETRKQAYVRFKKNELRDTDGDGLPEIVDGWGMPFLYVARDRVGREANVEPHEGKNPESFSLYSFGPDKLGYYRGKNRGELDYPVGDLDFDGKSDSSDESEMKDRIQAFAKREGYSPSKADEMANKDNITNWERQD
jgi:prepilin-type N-terminal cleavage/methylation domain-containing protein